MEEMIHNKIIRMAEKRMLSILTNKKINIRNIFVLAVLAKIVSDVTVYEVVSLRDQLQSLSSAEVRRTG